MVVKVMSAKVTAIKVMVVKVMTAKVTTIRVTTVEVTTTVKFIIVIITVTMFQPIIEAKIHHSKL